MENYLNQSVEIFYKQYINSLGQGKRLFTLSKSLKIIKQLLRSLLGNHTTSSIL